MDTHPFEQGFDHWRLLPRAGVRPVGLAGSVGSAAPDAVYLSQEVHPGWPFDARGRHFRFELVRSDEGAGRVETIPFEEKSKVVDVSSAAKNAATALAVFVPPIEVGIENRFPRHIIGDLVMDKNIDHDFLGTPFR